MIAKNFGIVLLVTLGLLGCGIGELIDPFNPAKRLAKAEEELRTAKDDYSRLRPLGDAGMACVDLGQLDRANKYAEEVSNLSKRLYATQGTQNYLLGLLHKRFSQISTDQMGHG